MPDQTITARLAEAGQAVLDAIAALVEYREQRAAGTLPEQRLAGFRSDFKKSLRDSMDKEMWDRLWGPELESLGCVVSLALEQLDAANADAERLAFSIETFLTLTGIHSDGLRAALAAHRDSTKGEQNG